MAFPYRFSLFFWIVGAAAGFADTPVQTEPRTTVHLIDTETGQALAKAHVIVGNPTEIDLLENPFEPRKPSPADAKLPQRVDLDANEQGVVEVPTSVQDLAMVVMTETGLAFFPTRKWDPSTGQLQVPLKKWASLSGRAMHAGLPVPEAVIQIQRFSDMVFVSSVIEWYSPPLRHTVNTKTDREGRFTIDHLVPTQLEGREAPYIITQAEQQAQAGITKTSLSAGEHAQLEVAARVPCSIMVMGQFMDTDGKPILPAKNSQSKEVASKIAGPFITPVATSGSSMSLGELEVDDEGKFHREIHMSGTWSLALWTPTVYRFADRKTNTNGAYEFEVAAPSAERVKEVTVLDLGKVVLMRQP